MMKYMILIFFHKFCCIFLTVTCSKTNYFPHFPAGPYRLDFKAISRCDLPTNGKVSINWYLSKKSANETEIKGSFSPQVAIDDSLDLIVHMAVRDSIGGWKNNAFNYKSPRACSALLSLMGAPYNRMVESLGMKNHTICPVPAGTYVSTGMDTALVMESNIPKSFVYGTYKIRISYSKNKELYGCSVLIAEFKRPWE